MSYVLVSLVGDDATAANDEFARAFAVSHRPKHAFHGESPAHADVAAAVRETKTALVLGHDGGGSLRGASQGDPWITPQEFAKVFYDARVWVYACDTRGPTMEQDLDSFYDGKSLARRLKDAQQPLTSSLFEHRHGRFSWLHHHGLRFRAILRFTRHRVGTRF